MRKFKIKFKAFAKKYCKNPFKAGAMRLILFYQRHLSRHTCMFSPTCSEYTLRAINNRGFLIGTLYGLRRIIRCNPFAAGGYDPPPEKRKFKWVL